MARRHDGRPEAVGSLKVLESFDISVIILEVLSRVSLGQLCLLA